MWLTISSVCASRQPAVSIVYAFDKEQTRRPKQLTHTDESLESVGILQSLLMNSVMAKALKKELALVGYLRFEYFKDKRFG